MSEKPSHGEEYGPCAICGKTALPMFGNYLCKEHGTLKHAKRVDDE
jgi:hypothetical protein